MWQQHSLTLRARPRGAHLITHEIEQELKQQPLPQIGLLHVFLQHTSASLTINENADPDVRSDLEYWLNRIAPERDPAYQHTLEGDDDLPAHLKSMLLGVSLTIPIRHGRLALGTWQGIYLCEHRNHAGARRVLLTIQGE